MTTGGSTTETTFKPQKTEGVNPGNSPVTEKTTSGIHKTIDEVAAKAASAEEAIRAKAASAGQAMEHKFEKQKEVRRTDVQRIKQRSEHYLQMYPAATIGISFGAGFLAARLLQSRKNGSGGASAQLSESSQRQWQPESRSGVIVESTGVY
jgi:ElaB/YqjD/DUF883 family membrane-anchored ribosome-binding protein